MWSMFAPFIREKANELGPMMVKQEQALGAQDLVYVISKKIDNRDLAPDENGTMVANGNKGKFLVFLTYMDRKKISLPGAKSVHFEMTYVYDENGKPIISGLDGLLEMLAGGE